MKPARIRSMTGMGRGRGPSVDGHVFLAEHAVLGRKVAVKALSDGI